MKIEVHLLQNFAPSNLNRDDTGAPKDCDLGGHRRARISSQCQKRAVREAFRLEGLIAPEDLGARTKRIVHEVARVLEAQYDHDRTAAAAVVLAALEGAGLRRTSKGEGEDAWKTEYLLFVPRRVIGALADLLHRHWDQLSSQAVEPGADDDGVAKGKKPSKKELKSSAKAAYPKEIRDEVVAHLESARQTADVALFGRMIADSPGWNVEASCQVAHAISTNRVQMDFDFFTAVDDFQPGDTTGSDMMGTVQFNSSCYYRYAVLDVTALQANLDLAEGNRALLARAVDAFLRAFVCAIPTGKQNSMAAHNFPSYLLALVRDRGQPISLTNAFLKPAKPREDADLVDDSIDKLEDYYGRIKDAFNGTPRLALSWADRDLKTVDDLKRSSSLNDFFGQVTGCALGGQP